MWCRFESQYFLFSFCFNIFQNLRNSRIPIRGSKLNLSVGINFENYKTSRFPYIGSWCVLYAVVSQNVNAAVCFQSLSTNHAFKHAFIAMIIMTGSPSHLGRLPISVISVSHIVQVKLCWSHCVSMCHYLDVKYVIFVNYDNFLNLKVSDV